MASQTSSENPLYVASRLRRIDPRPWLRQTLPFLQRSCSEHLAKTDRTQRVGAASTPVVVGADPKPRQRGEAGVLAVLLGVVLVGQATAGASAAPLNLELNRPLQFGWYALRVQNPFGTNYTGITAIKSYNPASKEFVFLNAKGGEVVVKEEDISFIYFRQLPERSDVNVRDGNIRNLQITPYREFLYNINPGRLAIQDGVLFLNTRWRIAEQKPFGVNTNSPAALEGLGEQIEIPRRIQLNYLGNHYLVETELVNVVVGDRPLPGASTVPRPVPSPFRVPTPSVSPAPMSVPAPAPR